MLAAAAGENNSFCNYFRMGYCNTLIAVAEDSPVDHSVVPEGKGDRKTVSVLQYEMLADKPYRLTQEDVLFDSWLARHEPDQIAADARREELRKRFFSKPQPCLRSSPLPKRYGWGILFDADGKISLCPMESKEYKRILSGKVTGVKVLKALRSSRA